MSTKVVCKKSLLKTISWRFVASLDTFLISWLITGNALAGFSIASIEVLTKMFLYYYHERFWNRINLDNS